MLVFMYTITFCMAFPILGNSVFIEQCLVSDSDQIKKERFPLKALELSSLQLRELMAWSSLWTHSPSLPSRRTYTKHKALRVLCTIRRSVWLKDYDRQTLWTLWLRKLGTSPGSSSLLWFFAAFVCCPLNVLQLNSSCSCTQYLLYFDSLCWLTAEPARLFMSATKPLYDNFKCCFSPLVSRLLINQICK